MKGDRSSATTIDEYIAGFPPDVRDVLKTIRATIRTAAPDAEEAISYGLPTFRLNGNLVHFGAFKDHIGFYPTASGTQRFEAELRRYDGSKGSVRFPLDSRVPLGLIGRIVKFRVRANLERARAKAKKKR
jgi:uncharacterized protein YdhG (YjbR/CyaY superfamily)